MAQVQDESLVLVLAGLQLAKDLGVLSSLCALVTHLQNGTVGPPRVSSSDKRLHLTEK